MGFAVVFRHLDRGETEKRDLRSDAQGVKIKNTRLLPGERGSLRGILRVGENMSHMRENKNRTGRHARRGMGIALAALLLAACALLGTRLWQLRQHRSAVAGAEALYEAGDYAAAREAFLDLGLTERAGDCDERLLRGRYETAEALLTAGDYLEAKEEFLELGPYADAAARAVECDCRRADAYAEDGRLGEAISLAESLGDYPGAAELARQYRDELYDRALEATYACRMDEAVRLWNELGDYRDGSLLLRRCLERISTVAEGTDEPVRYSEYAGRDLGNGTLYYHRLGLIYVPKDAGPETSCMIFYPGGYDEALANSYLVDYVYTPDPPNAIMLMCYANGYGDMPAKVEDSYRALEQAAIENNVFLHGLVLCGASMGAYTACQGAALLYENHGLCVDKVLTFDAGMHWEVERLTLTPEQCDSAAKAGARFMLLEFGGVGMNKRPIELMVAHGNDVTVVECARGGHYGIITDAMESGLIDWALGRGELPENDNYSYHPLDRQSTYPF